MAKDKSFYLEKLEESLRSDSERDFVGQFTGVSNDRIKRLYLNQQLRELNGNIKTPGRWQYNPLYDHQSEAIESTLNHFADPEKPSRAYTVIPTGGGKTEVFAHIVNSLGHEFQVGSEHVSHCVTPPTIILVPTEDLVGQTVERLQRNFPSLEVGQYYGKKKEIRPVTVMVYNSFVKAVDSKENIIQPEDVSYIIMDEAHRGLSDFRQDIFEKFKDKAISLAYTATPAFGDDKNIEQLFGANTQAYSTTISRLIRDGRLAPVDNYIVHIDIKFDEGAKPEKDKDLKKIIRVAKMRAALEFLLTHEDPDTGEMLAGRTTIGFNRYANLAQDQSSAAGTAAYFDREIRKRMEEDPVLAARLQEFDRMAEYVASSHSESDDVIERVKNGETMAMFNVKYAREGTDIPRIYNVLNIQGSGSLVDTLQGNGRALRIVRDDPYKRASIVDFHVTINGLPVEERRPLFFYEAVNDESIVKDVITQPMVIDTKTKREMLREADEMEAGGTGKPKVVAKTTTTTITKPGNRFRDRDEFRELVIGTGTAAEKYGQRFDELYDQLEQHYRDQQGSDDPVPFFVDGREIKVREEDGNIQVHSYAYQPFRNAIGFPRQKTSAYVDESEIYDFLLKKGNIAIEYKPRLDDLLGSMKEHYERHQHSDEIPPFYLDNAQKSVPTLETVDAAGDLVMALPVWAKRTLDVALGIPRDKTPRWKDRAQFAQLVLGDVADKGKYMQEFNRLWSDMQQHCERQRYQAVKDDYMLGDQPLHVDYCMGEHGERVFCVAREAAAPIRKHLSVSKDEWKLTKQDLLNGVFYNASLDDVHNVTVRKKKATVFTDPPEGWINLSELKSVRGIRAPNTALSGYFAETRHGYTHKDDRNPYTPLMEESFATDYVTRKAVGRYRNPENNKVEWYINPDRFDEAVHQEAIKIVAPRAGWHKGIELYNLNKKYWETFLGNHRSYNSFDDGKLYRNEMARLTSEGTDEVSAAKKLREDGVVAQLHYGKHFQYMFGVKTMEHFAHWLRDNPEDRQGIEPAKEGYISEQDIIEQYDTPEPGWGFNKYHELFSSLVHLREEQGVADRDEIYDVVRKEFPRAFGDNWVGHYYSPEVVKEMEDVGIIKPRQQQAQLDPLEEFRRQRLGQKDPNVRYK